MRPTRSFAHSGDDAKRRPAILPLAETITDAMLTRVFGVAEAADHISSGIPFILPHATCKVRRDERQLSNDIGRRADAGVI
jgi:hypothetical protein